MFDSHRLKNLLSLFKHRMWPQAQGDLKLARIASSLESGYWAIFLFSKLKLCQNPYISFSFRRPLIPSLKDGVVALLSSSSNFSQELFDLDRETKCEKNISRINHVSMYQFEFLSQGPFARCPPARATSRGLAWSGTLEQRGSGWTGASSGTGINSFEFSLASFLVQFGTFCTP